MISRRLLRVKALQVVYAYRTSGGNDIRKAEKELSHSIERSFDLFHMMLLLLLDLASYAEQRMEIGRSKYFPTDEESNPNTRFIDNRLISQIKHNDSFLKYLSHRKVSWASQEDLIKSLYRDMIQWEGYQDYLSNPSDTYAVDRSFLVKLLSELIVDHEFLTAVLEEQSIYWNDDIHFIGAMIIKTFDRWKPQSGKTLPGMFKDEDDETFVIDLLRRTIIHRKEYEELIKDFTENWDFDRLALMDILIMQMAVTEVVHFPSIPVKVSLNEYIEISKYYSTDKSSLFINGILDKIFSRLREEKKINKTGRGLVGEKPL